MGTHQKSPNHAADCRCLLCVDHEYLAYQVGDRLYVETVDGHRVGGVITDISPIERCGDIISRTLTLVEKLYGQDHGFYYSTVCEMHTDEEGV